MATYSFRTTKNWRVDADGITPKKAYKQAIEKHREYTGNKDDTIFGVLTKSYITYRNGLAPLDSWKVLK